MSFTPGPIIVKCPVCKVEVAPAAASDLLEWWPRHCAVMKQCITGDPKRMVEDFERRKEQGEKFQESVIRKIAGDSK